MGATHPTPAEETSALSRMLEGRQPDIEVLRQDIDARMAALNADHIEMGARPATEPGGDIHEATYPLKEKALPTSMTSGAKKAPKGTRAKKSK